MNCNIDISNKNKIIFYSKNQKIKSRNAFNEANKSVILKGTSPAAQSRRQSEAAAKESSPEPDFESSGDEEGLDASEKFARKERRLGREVTYLSAKLIRLKEKEEVAREERQKIRDNMKNNQTTLK